MVVAVPPNTPEEFRNFRVTLGLTQEELAAALDIHKRTIYNYERLGPIPKSVGLACLALGALINNRGGYVEEDSEAFEKLVKDQYPELGVNILVLPVVVRRKATYDHIVELSFRSDVQAWGRSNAPSAKFMVKTVITQDVRRVEVPVAVFDKFDELTYFKIRWC